MPSARHHVALAAALVILLQIAGACRDGGGPAPVPSSILSASSQLPSAEVGSLLSTPPAFVVRDAAGKALGGLAVTIVVGEGGGTLRNPPTRTSAGPTGVGQWTLGTKSGRNTLLIKVGKLLPFALEATANAGPPAEIRFVDGHNQEALAGEEVAASLSALIADRFGNPVPQQSVRFDVLSGGGEVAPATVQTGIDGIAGDVRWRLGSRSSIQSVRASLSPLSLDFAARARSEFTIDVRFPGTPPSLQIQEIFRNAAERIRTAVIGDLPDVAVQSLNVSGCGGGTSSALTETIDDIVIFASVSPIDGVGKVLGRAGPCYIRGASLQSLVGTMQFDDADAPALINSDRFQAVILHEMLHVVGIGSLWRLRALVDGSGTSDPRFNGANGISRCLLTGFGSLCAGGVPIENIGGTGTAEVHWRESIFDRELMTGFAEATPDMPFSAISVASLVDNGYVVNEKAADPFQFVAARVAPRASVAPVARWEEVLFPAFEVSPFGFVQPVRPMARVGPTKQ